MLKKYSQFFKGLFFLVDMGVILGCWILAYYWWFYTGFGPASGYIPALNTHLSLLIFILPVYALVFKWMGLYKSMCTQPAKHIAIDIVLASGLALLLVISFIYFVKKGFYYLRLTFFIYFWFLNIAGLICFREAVRQILMYLRRKGYNLRRVLIIGTEDLAREIARTIKKHIEFGLNIVGFLSRKVDDVDKLIDGIKVVGVYKDLRKTIEDRGIDQVIFALPSREDRITQILLNTINAVGVDVKVVPDFSPFYTLRKGVEEIGDLPVITLREGPLYGWNYLTKRLLDIGLSLLAIIIFSPLMSLIAILIKLTSAGPILYFQERTSLDGKRFKIIKFRTMKYNAEEETGPVWAKEGDSRRTRVGAILRKMSLDELPQIFNVLLGHMSFVGPRPERPVFVEKFRKHIPQYVLRHKIKGGITGWAQIHGFRGNTSIEKRVEYDLYYIENWSIWLDLKILFCTVPAIIRAKGAH